MSKAKVYVGAKVSHPKRGAGEIIRIITPSTGYVEVKYENGISYKEMAFNLSNSEGEPLKAKPKSDTSGMSKGEKKRFRDNQEREAYERTPNLQRIKGSIMSVNGLIQGDRNSLSWQLTDEDLYGIQHLAKEKGDSFVSSVIDSVRKFMRASEKQAYVIARFADANGVKAIWGEPMQIPEKPQESTVVDDDIAIRARAAATALRLKAKTMAMKY